MNTVNNEKVEVKNDNSLNGLVIIRSLGLLGIPPHILYYIGFAGLALLIVENLIGFNIPYFYIDPTDHVEYIGMCLGLIGINVAINSAAAKAANTTAQNLQSAASAIAGTAVTAAAIASDVKKEAVETGIEAVKAIANPLIATPNLTEEEKARVAIAQAKIAQIIAEAGLPITSSGVSGVSLNSFGLGISPKK